MVARASDAASDEVSRRRRLFRARCDAGGAEGRTTDARSTAGASAENVGAAAVSHSLFRSDHFYCFISGQG